jgi:hypothetical protein
VVNSAKYLGVIFNACGGFEGAYAHLKEATTRARFGLQRRLRELRHVPPKMQIRLFNTIVRSVMSYGSQIWGVDFLQLPISVPNGTSYRNLLPDNIFESVQLDFLRFVGGVSRCAPNWVLLQEFGVQPVQVHFARCVCRLWNDFRDMPNTMAAHAARADLALMFKGVKKCWSHKVCMFLAKLSSLLGLELIDRRFIACFTGNNRFPADSIAYFWGLRVDVNRITECLTGFWRDRVVRILTGNPRTTTIYVKSDAYVTWVGMPVGKPHVHVNQVIPRTMHATLMRFRIGCWSILEVNKDRSMGRGRRTRADRICTKCAAHTVEDELHVLLECSFYDDIRADYPGLFPSQFDATAATMRAVLNNANQLNVAECISRMWKKRVR